MLRTFFKKRSPLPNTQARSFRPRLEDLEERVVPDDTMFPGTTPTYGPSVPAYSTSDTPSSEGSFAANSLQAFGLPPSAYALYALGGAPVSGYAAVPGQTVSSSSGGGFGGFGGGGGGGGGGAANVLGQVEQLTGALYLSAETQNPQAARSLVADEIFRGLDSYISQVGQSMGMNNLMQGNIAAYQNAINQNPLEQTQVGQLLGSLVYDLTVYNLSTGQAGGF